MSVYFHAGHDKIAKKKLQALLLALLLNTNEAKHHKPKQFGQFQSRLYKVFALLRLLLKTLQDCKTLPRVHLIGCRVVLTKKLF